MTSHPQRDVEGAGEVERMAIEARVLATLAALHDRLGLDYEILDCDPDLADTATFCETYGFTLDASANTILVTGKSDPPVNVACVALATTRLDVNGLIRRRLGVRKASFAAGSDTVALTAMEIGGVTPFGLPEDLEVWVDAAVLEQPQLILGGGSRAIKVLTGPAMLVALAAVTVVEGLATSVHRDSRSS